MSLGNSNSSSKSRGKNKPTKIKRRREVKAADRYLSFTGSALDATQGGACRLRDVNITYYHNGAGPIPRPGEIIYREKRARSDNRFGPGYIQFQDRGRGFTIQINDAGVVIGTILPC
jgi:hypothetical protein